MLLKTRQHSGCSTWSVQEGYQYIIQLTIFQWILKNAFVRKHVLISKAIESSYAFSFSDQ